MDRATLIAVFRAVYCSLALLGRFRSSKRLLWAIAEAMQQSPDMEGYSLWLQHKAILKLYKHEGYEKIVAKMDHLRSTLFWYLDLKVGLTSDKKEILRARVKEFPGMNSVDNDFNLRAWLDNSQIRYT